MRRSTTRELLGATYQETIGSPLSSAPGPRRSNEYDEDRVRHSLQWADETIRNSTRTLAPIGIQAVRLYKETCASYLSLGETDAKKEYIAAIIVMEKAFNFHLFLDNTNAQQGEQLLQDELVRLYQSQFYARYGEYFLDFCGELGIEADAEMKKFTGWEKLQRSYWAEIGDKIESEKDSWIAYKKGNMDAYKKCPTHKALFHTSMKIGMEFKGALEAITHYAKRNELLHGNLFQMVRGGYYDIRKTL